MHGLLLGLVGILGLVAFAFGEKAAQTLAQILIVTSLMAVTAFVIWTVLL